MDLSKVERLILSNQFSILEALYPAKADYYRNNKKALDEGFKLHYYEIFKVLSDNTLTEEECREVLDILYMYRSINFSYQSLKDSTGVSTKLLEFKGFDINDKYEKKRVMYTRYLINDLKMYEELKYGNPYADFISYGEMLPTYNKMLNIWRDLGEEYKLNKSNLIKILGSI